MSPPARAPATAHAARGHAGGGHAGRGGGSPATRGAAPQGDAGGHRAPAGPADGVAGPARPMAPGVPVGVRSLRRFLVAGQRQALPEACQLCATPVPQRHPHLVHVLDRRLLCACWACALLFEYGGPERPGAAGGYRRVPDRYLSDPGFRLTDAQWEQLQIPVGLAFFLRNSARDQVIACYPGPAGATESELGLPAWSGGLGAGRLAAELEPDVEALLVRRDRAGGGGNGECLLVPVDACYRLAGLVRRHWRGFDGGSEAWQAIEACFQELRELARPLPPAGTGV